MVRRSYLLLTLLALSFCGPTVAFLAATRPALAQGADAPARLCLSADEEEGDIGAVGVIIVDHGSKRQAANDMISEVAKRYKAFSGAGVVEAAHMELAEPSIKQAFQACVDQGATTVICHPFFLSPGRHVTTDIPALMSEAAEGHPNVSWSISDPLGLQPLMPELMHQTIKGALKQHQS
ncbi:unnamed protein product [Chrysoparadoxa australica]